MENVKILDIQELCEAIKDEIDNFCIEYNVPDIRQASQNIWNGCLSIVCQNVVIPNNYLLWVKNQHKYLLENIMYLLDFYIVLCNINEKECSAIGFSKLTNINQDTIYEWGNSTNEYIYTNLMGEVISIKYSEIHKKLSIGREESLSNMLISGKRNPVGILGALNHRYGWNTQNQVLEVRQTALVERSALGISAKPTETDDIKPPSTDQ